MYKKIVIVMFLLAGFTSFVSAAWWNLPGVTIITRAQWWADETLRYTDKSKTERDALRQQQKDTESNSLVQNESQGQIATDYLIATTPSEQLVDQYRESFGDNFLKWPESIHFHKTKIIIHHTADDNTALMTWWKDAAIIEMQNIYKYHALTRGWGDIGYNFVIDPFGNIYEGRAWWPWVVGAHVAWNNTPTVGISMMWNFNVNVPTDAALKALVKLTTALAKKYRINPKATTTYFKVDDTTPYLKAYTNYTLAGHQDAWVTSCPGANLYALFPEIRDQVSENLSKIALVVYKKPVIAPKIERGSIVAGRYYSDTITDTFTLPIRWTGIQSCTTSDDTIAIGSCSSNDNKLSISLTKKWISGLKTISVVTSEGTKTFSMNLIRQEDFATIANKLKQEYATRKSITPSSQSITKITSKITLSDLKTLVDTPLNILLYELSTSYSRYEISCDGWCTIQTDETGYTDTNPIIETSNGFVYLTLPTFENALAVTHLEISSVDGGLVRVNNYLRKSYGGTQWNTFRGSLIWKKESIKNLATSEFVDQAVVINKTSFDNYMKGIAETSDTENREKQKLVLLLAKMYTLFYINGQNTHPSIPAGASYQAIDNPDMFQKYVWAGREKTSTMSAGLLADIKNTVIMYNGYVPILPYFSCSAGFTRSAKEKRGWNDTPYLQSKLDFAACFDFNWHGVGLSGKWAQYLAEKWWTLEQILQYYYPGVDLEIIN
ncbi:MAG: N-acetylmuramoyl-L-alanine amidase family 2 [uncultured bacterium (gcode 4)]|uniref:N-acetylmuramoyl-L-alanine amidase family 2 n=1 Tax=uncultured bacterium (gcode 4) TaxID=1234023 RepID=K1X431_9BACT|nr:MAG: N-acetylmuramoyl-L-alanine amidase family 2 [uncultured bacterium (gcode 4)]